MEGNIIKGGDTLPYNIPARLAHGRISMAYQLSAITAEEYIDLEHKCVAEGINNSEYFD